MNILTNFDFKQNQIMNVVIHKLATAPTDPTSGQIYFDTSVNRAFIWSGIEWVGIDSLDAKMSGGDIITAINTSEGKIADANLSDAVRETITKSHSEHTILDVSGLSSALDSKVDNTRVLSDVPLGAKFTDTVYSVFDTVKDGLVPKTTQIKEGEFLKSDGTWAIPKDSIYSLPVATGLLLGGIKEGVGVSIAVDGKLSIVNDGHTHSIPKITGLTEAISNSSNTAVGNAKEYTDLAIANLIGTAPDTLDTLNEIATALGNDPNFATTMTNEMGKKTNKFSQKIGGIATQIVTHNLNSRDITISIRETSAPYSQVITDVEMTTVNTVTVRFAKAPLVDEYTITLVG